MTVFKMKITVDKSNDCLKSGNKSVVMIPDIMCTTGVVKVSEKLYLGC